MLYSLAFLYETPGPILEATKTVTGSGKILVYGISDKEVGGLSIQRPDGNPPIAFPKALLNNVLQPFKKEVTEGSGTRMHHKFVVIDFDKPSARVYLGSYNFSSTADTKNGENLLLIQDQKIATSYMVEAVAMFDHYEFRDALHTAGSGNKLYLKKPPTNKNEVAWWMEDFSNLMKIRDREIFS